MVAPIGRRDVVYCNECSREVGENLFHSAPRADVWLLLEYDGSWGAQALPDSDLPPAVKARLSAWMAAIPNSKVLFIKRGPAAASPRLYLALTREHAPALYRFELAGYERLVDLDLEALSRGDPAFEQARADEIVFAVCVNGRRDPACARYGTPVYQALAKVAGETVWQCTHLGGHRFAGTLVSLPTGVCYGYLDADDAADVGRAVAAGEVLLERTRGRSCYDAPVQAADYFLRGITGIRAVNGVRLLDLAADEEVWTARLVTPDDGQVYAVRVRRELSPWTTYESTGDPERKRVPQFHLIDYAPAGA